MMPEESDEALVGAGDWGGSPRCHAACTDKPASVAPALPCRDVRAAAGPGACASSACFGTCASGSVQVAGYCPSSPPRLRHGGHQLRWRSAHALAPRTGLRRGRPVSGWRLVGAIRFAG